MSVLIYNTKQPVGEAPVMLELGGMRSTPSWQSLSCLLWAGVVAPEMAQIELFNI